MANARRPSSTSPEFLNGLHIGRLSAEADEQWRQSALFSPARHPFTQLLSPRDPQSVPSLSREAPDTDPPPATYSIKQQLRWPHSMEFDEDEHGERRVHIHSTIRLRDIEAFRSKSVRRLKNQLEPRGAEPTRAMIYRYIDATFKGYALMEVIHFEVFCPDRSDLRFVAVPFSKMYDEGALEGEYFKVEDVDLCPEVCFTVQIGRATYPVVWTAPSVVLLEISRGADRRELAYVLDKKQSGYQQMFCVSETAEHIGPSKNRQADLDPTEDPSEDDTKAEEASEDDLSEAKMPVRTLPIHRHHCIGEVLPEPRTIITIATRLTSAAHLYPVEPIADIHEYLKRLRGIRTSSSHSGRVLAAARCVAANETIRIDDRLSAFNGYGKTGDLELMESLFSLGSRFREVAAPRADPLEDTHHDESVVVRALSDDDRYKDEHRRKLLDYLYATSGDREPVGDDGRDVDVPRVDGSILRLNLQQSRVLKLCKAERPPLVACIQSPPGSGKTTIAAATAASGVGSVGSPVLLLAMQNIAVDQMATMLKTMDHQQVVYNVKSTARLDPFFVSPYDWFEHIGAVEMRKWKERKTELNEMEAAYRQAGDAGDFKARSILVEEYRVEVTKYKKKLFDAKVDFENELRPTVLLATVELALRKRVRDEAISRALKEVKKVIIDEASLVTEAAMYCLFKQFPQAQFVLLGDREQLPPFMYDDTGRDRGHELAGRSALFIAMQSRRTPILSLINVYRAPQSLVEPYNRVAYDRQLVSNKPEISSPLTDIGLVPAGSPQLLFIKVSGDEEREPHTKSLYNKDEMDTLVRLLMRFPPGSAQRIMIITLYKEQKKRVRAAIAPDYAVMTVNSSQGKEKPICIVLTSRSTNAANMDFFNDRKRCNVAISRQQEALVIMGHPGILVGNEPWKTAVDSDANDFTRVEAKDV